MSLNSFWSVATPLAYRLRGDRSFAYLGEMLSRRDWSAARLQELQLAKLKALLQHCQREVPYYQDLFRTTGFDPEAVSRLEDLRVLPVLTKNTVRANGDRLIAGSMRGRLRIHHTGGSTGIPLTFYRHQEYEELAFAGMLRDFHQCGWRVGEPIAQFWGVSGARQLGPRARLVRGLKETASRFFRFNAFDVSPENTRLWHRRLQALGPAAWFGYASTIYLVCQHLAELRLGLPGAVRGVFTTAEPLYDFQRELIEKTLACKVYNVYGSTEVLDVSCECRCGRMHVRTDAAVVEYGEAAPGGGRELILTSLNNYAMPYLRYANEDLAEPVDGACECGDCSPLMSFPMGRTFGNFTAPSGQIIHGQFFVKLLYDVAGIERFQFHQVSKDEIVLKVVKGRAFSAETAARLAQAIERIHGIAGNDLRVRIEYTADIPATARGKFLYTKNDLMLLEPPAAGATAAAAPRPPSP